MFIVDCIPPNRQTRTRLHINALDAFVLGFENVLWDPSTKKLYEGVKESLSATDMPFYIISEASPSHVSSVLKEDAGVDIPADSPRLMQAEDEAAKLCALKQVSIPSESTLLLGMLVFYIHKVLRLQCTNRSYKERCSALG